MTYSHPATQSDLPTVHFFDFHYLWYFLTVIRRRVAQPSVEARRKIDCSIQEAPFRFLELPVICRQRQSTLLLSLDLALEVPLLIYAKAMSQSLRHAMIS